MTAPAITGTAGLFDALAITDADGTERWSARDLQSHLGYVEWRKFEDAIGRAKVAAENVRPGEAHFVGAAKSSPMPNGGFREVQDYLLTRFGAYLLAMNGDPRKAEVAAAQAYFAVQTRRAETVAAAPALPQDYLTALKALTAEVEARQAAEALQARTEVRALTAERDLTETRPSADAWNRVFASKADWSLQDASGQLARAGIKIGPRQLQARIIGFGWAYRNTLPDGRPGAVRPYAEATKQGLLVVQPLPPREKGGRWITPAPQIRLTGKGLAKTLALLSPAAPQLPIEVHP